MHKRIFSSFAVLLIVCVAALATLLSFLFMRAVQTHEMEAMRDKAYLIAGLLDSGTFDYGERLSVGSTRMTIIDPSGKVLFDNHPGTDFTENRSDREEFIEAMTFGSGESIRKSVTFGADTYYYAIRLDNGNVLRLSRTLSSLREIFPTILPYLIIATIVIWLISYFITYRLTKRIIKPLTQVDFESLDSVSDSALGRLQYEELWPFVKKIDEQKHEIKSQMMQLKIRAETIEAIIANMREGLAMLDDKGLVLAVNKSVLDIFGVSEENDILHKNFGHIYRDPEFIGAVKQCLGGEHLEINFTRNDRFYNAFLSPARSGGAIIIFLDLTDRHIAETHRREFTANVSHELRTPLTTISALSEMMAGGMTKTEKMTEYSQKISEQAKRLVNIIDDIFRLSEFDESKTETDFTEFDVFDLARSVIASLKDKADERSVRLTLKGQPLKIVAAIRLIDELLYNLIDNAVKYNKDGGNVTVEISREEDLCKISVADTGIGILEKHQDRIFERFYRVDNSRSKKTGGTGLGLSIVKHITEHHGGKIALDSTEGVGTTITCYIAQTKNSTMPDMRSTL